MTTTCKSNIAMLNCKYKSAIHNYSRLIKELKKLLYMTFLKEIEWVIKMEELIIELNGRGEGRGEKQAFLRD